ncbi:MAG: 4Fe-4S dicluster domain-containing protein [Proteobacteria bacterium]|nr:4Fe-4S dicluster domain-containing protein [Pseudomonadota bacterium]
MAKIRYGMVIDLRRCIGCHSCSVACKAENNVPLGVFRSWVKIIEKGQYPNVSRHFLPSLCNHCNNPPCVINCPVQATWKQDDGIVIIDEHRCIGCKYCIASCPYNARHVNPIIPIVQKCYWCHHRVYAGLVPACVETCPTTARAFGNLLDPNDEVAKLLARNPFQAIKPEMGTYPMVFYIGADADAMDPFAGKEEWT